MQGDNPDILILEATQNIPGNTVFYITDNEWSSTNNDFVDLNEDEHSWTTPVSGVASGSIIQLSLTTASCGTLSGTPAFSAGQEEVYLLSVTPSITNGSVTSSDICFALSTGGTGDLPAGTSVNVGNFDNTSYNGSGDITSSSNWTSSDGTVTLATANCIALPVELINFIVSKSTTISHLSFTTASETNNSHFNIERSADARNFESIGEIKGAGNSSKEINYTFTDERPLPGINYYRIKQTDFDGQYSYSEIRSVRHKGISNVSITPRTTDGRVGIITELEDYSIAIYNAAGQEVKKITGMSLDQSISIETLHAGVYFVKINSGSESETVRIVKI